MFVLFIRLATINIGQISTKNSINHFRKGSKQIKMRKINKRHLIEIKSFLLLFKICFVCSVYVYLCILGNFFVVKSAYIIDKTTMHYWSDQYHFVTVQNVKNNWLSGYDSLQNVNTISYVLLRSYILVNTISRTNDKMI